MTDPTAKIREALERIDFHCQPGDDAGNVEWWVTVNGECKGGTKIGHGSIIMRAFMDWKRARDEALALLDAERPSAWISVADRLPEISDYPIAIGHFNFEDKDWEEVNAVYIWMRKVGELPTTHWMPLPPPPDAKETP